VAAGLGGLPGGGDLGDPLADDRGVGAGLQGGPVAGEAPVAVGQQLPGSRLLGAAGRLLVAGGSKRLAGRLQMVGVAQPAQPGVDPGQQVDLLQVDRWGWSKPAALAYSTG
jgi:hypothetical protein